MKANQMALRALSVYSILILPGYALCDFVPYCSQEEYRTEYIYEPAYGDPVQSEWFGYRVGLTDSYALIGRNIAMSGGLFNLDIYTLPAAGLSPVAEVDPLGTGYYTTSPGGVSIDTSTERFLLHFRGSNSVLVGDLSGGTPSYSTINRPQDLLFFGGDVPAPGTGDLSNYILAIDGDDAIVGHNQYELEAGYEYVAFFFEFDDGTWQQNGAVTDPNGYVGRGVDIHDGVAAIRIANDGIAIYRKDPNGDWDYDSTIEEFSIEFDFNDKDELCVMVSNDEIHVYEYEPNTPSWSHSETLSIQDLGLYDNGRMKVDSDWLVVLHENYGDPNATDEIEVFRRGTHGWQEYPCLTGCAYGSNWGTGQEGVPGTLDLRNGTVLAGEPFYINYDFLDPNDNRTDGIVVSFDLAEMLEEEVDQVRANALNNYELADMNCDGSVNAFDVDPYISALLYRAQYEADYPCCSYLLGDMNCSDALDSFDTDPFITAVTNGGAACPHCPCD